MELCGTGPRGRSGPADESTVVYPQGHAAEFIFAVLRAWRANAVVCPLEPDQAPPPVPLPPAPCVHLKTTSATTGLPRTIAFTAEQLAADAENIVATMGLRPDWPNLGVISMAHSYGFSNLVLPLLLHGIPLILAPSPLPEAVRRAAEGEPALTLAGVPALWRAWHEAGAIPPNVRLAISAGAPLPVTLEQAVFSATGVKIHNFYGSTECGGIAYDATATPRADEACVGAPMRNVQVALNEDGCLEVRSQAVGQTYWPDADGDARKGLLPDERPGGDQGRLGLSPRPRAATRSMSRAGRSPRRTSSKRCGSMRRSPNVWFSACQAGTRSHGSNRSVCRGNRHSAAEELRQFLLQDCRLGKCRANGGLWNHWMPTRAGKFRAPGGAASSSKCAPRGGPRVSVGQESSDT